MFGSTKKNILIAIVSFALFLVEDDGRRINKSNAKKQTENEN